MCDALFITCSLNFLRRPVGRGNLTGHRANHDGRSPEITGAWAQGTCTAPPLTTRTLILPQCQLPVPSNLTAFAHDSVVK